MFFTNFKLVDHNNTPAKVGWQKVEETVTVFPPGIAAALDSLTHAKINGISVTNYYTTDDTIKTAPETGDYADKTFKLNCTFKAADGTAVKAVIKSPKAKIHPGLENYIYLADVDGGKMLSVLPGDGVGLSGEDVARKIETMRGLPANSLTFISGSLSKDPT